MHYARPLLAPERNIHGTKMNYLMAYGGFAETQQHERKLVQDYEQELKYNEMLEGHSKYFANIFIYNLLRKQRQNIVT